MLLKLGEMLIKYGQITEASNSSFNTLWVLADTNVFIRNFHSIVPLWNAENRYYLSLTSKVCKLAAYSGLSVNSGISEKKQII